MGKCKKTIRLIVSIIALAAFPAFSIQALADEVKAKDYGVLSGNPVKIQEYSRMSSTATLSSTVSLAQLKGCNQPGVLCKNFVAGSPVTATATCTGASTDGGWTMGAVSGQCFDSITVCYGTDTANPVCVNVKGKPAAPGDIAFTPVTLCTDPDPDKNFCVINYTANGQGVSEAKGLKNINGLTGATGDDMFRLDNKGHGFFEYAALGDIGAPYRLEYLVRSGGQVDKGMVIPSGPGPGTANSFSDFKRFIDHPPVNQDGSKMVTAEKACYPAQIDLCPNQPVLPPVAGACGSASGSKFSTVPTSDLCIVGKASAVVGAGPWYWTCPGYMGGSAASCVAQVTPTPGECGASNGTMFTVAPKAGLCKTGTASTVAGNGPWTWTCAGAGGGATASCSANYGLPLKCMYTGQSSPPEQTQCPTPTCFFNVSGGVLLNNYKYGVASAIGQPEYFSNLVGPGNYPTTNPGPFGKADQYTFDGIAIGSDTHIIIYSQPWFQGGVVLDIKGPIVINNYVWRDYPLTAALLSSWQYEWWSGGPYNILNQFPPSTRKWSDQVGAMWLNEVDYEFGGPPTFPSWMGYNMHNWGHNKSLKVTCPTLEKP